MNSLFVLGVGVGIVSIIGASIYLVYLKWSQTHENEDLAELKGANELVTSHIQSSNENIFLELGFNPDEAENLLMRAKQILNVRASIK